MRQQVKHGHARSTVPHNVLGAISRDKQHRGLHMIGHASTWGCSLLSMTNISPCGVALQLHCRRANITT